MKNEGKLSIQFEELESFLVDLFNKCAERGKGKFFGEITIYRHGAVGLEIFEKAGIKVVSLFKRDFYPLSPALIHRKVNSVVAHEAEEVDRLEQYILGIWTTLQEKSPQLFKELQSKNLGPVPYLEPNVGRSALTSKIETRNLTTKEISEKAKRCSSGTKPSKTAAEITSGAPITLSKPQKTSTTNTITVSTVNKPQTTQTKPRQQPSTPSTPSRKPEAQKLLQPAARPETVKPKPAVADKPAPSRHTEQKKPKSIMKASSLRTNRSLSEAVAG